MKIEPGQMKLDHFTEGEKPKVEQKPVIFEGQLPNGWRWVKLGSVAEIIMGQSPPSETYNEDGVGLPFYQGKADFGVFFPTPRKWCSKPLKIALPNDILISVRAPVGPVNFCREKSCIGRGLAAIRLTTEIVPMYAFFYLRFKEQELMELGKGSTFGAIKRKDLENVLIPLPFRDGKPDIEEQRRVVARVEELTSRIEQAKKLREEALKETEKIMQTALHQTFKNPEQKGWKQYTINEITVDLKSGFACSKKYEVPEGIPHLRPNNIGYYGKLDLSKIVCIPENMVDLKTYSLKRGDVLFNNTNSKELVGRAALVEEDLNYAFSNHITRIRVNTELLTPEWLVTCLNYLWLKGYFLHICQKWIGQAGINTRMLKSVKVYIPSIEEQKAITERLNKIQKIIENFNTQQNKTKAEIESLSQAILKAAFSGKL